MKHFFIFLFAVCFCITANSQNNNDINYKVGDRLEVKHVNTWYLAQIIEVLSGGEYRIKYDIDGHTHYVKHDRMRPLEGVRYDRRTNNNSTQKTPVKTPIPNNKNSMTPEIGGNGLPKMGGTAWDIISVTERGKAPVSAKGVYGSFVYCKSGRWSQPAGYSGYGPIGTYKIDGNKVSHRNATNGLTTVYIMTWKSSENMLELESGKWKYRVQLSSKNACGERSN